VEGHGTLCPRLKKRGAHPSCPPPNCAHALIQTCAARRVVWCVLRVVLFLILKWYFKWITFLNFSCYSFHNHPQAFALDQRFAALEVHEQRTVTFFNYLATTDHKANINFRTICNFYATAQTKLFMMQNFFVIEMRGLQRLCCVKLFEQFVKTWQVVVYANWELLDLILAWEV